MPRRRRRKGRASDRTSLVLIVAVGLIIAVSILLYSATGGGSALSMSPGELQALGAAKAADATVAARHQSEQIARSASATATAQAYKEAQYYLEMTQQAYAYNVSATQTAANIEATVHYEGTQVAIPVQQTRAAQEHKDEVQAWVATATHAAQQEELIETLGETQEDLHRTLEIQRQSTVWIIIAVFASGLLGVILTIFIAWRIYRVQFRRFMTRINSIEKWMARVQRRVDRGGMSGRRQEAEEAEEAGTAASISL